MDSTNSLADHMIRVLTCLLQDVADTYTGMFGITSQEVMLNVNRDVLFIERRAAREGTSFLTKSLPALGKHFDACLSGKLTFQPVGFSRIPGSTSPKFLGFLFERVFDSTGALLPCACTYSIRQLRQVLYLFYKYELPYQPETIERTFNSFINTDEDLVNYPLPAKGEGHYEILDVASKLLARVLSDVSPTDFIPKHGPGSVSTREEQFQKMRFFKRSFPALEEVFGATEYFFAGAMDICDNYHRYFNAPSETGTAKVVLVPKDSRGPRLISCEPLEYQYIQQGVSRAIVKIVEKHCLTAGHVNFTDQTVNRKLALYGSIGAPWVTLDMKDASDRVSLDLVSRLFSRSHILPYLLAARTSQTRLPNGQLVIMRKYAPMGSALCFPVEALTFWALAVSCIYTNYRRLNLREEDALQRAKASVYVYGDDLILHREDYAHVMQVINSVGLKFNEAKCCTVGSFRESCGLDAFNGVDVTPVKIRTVWDPCSPCIQQLTSWVALSNELYRQGYWMTCELIRGDIALLYGDIVPYVDNMENDYSFLHFVCHILPDHAEPRPRKWSTRLQRPLIKAVCVVSDPFALDLIGYERLRWALIKPPTELAYNRRDPWSNPGRRLDSQFVKDCEPPSVQKTDTFSLRDRVVLKTRWCII